MSNEPARKRTFTVRLVRPVFQFMDVRVRATSDAQAASAAARKAIKAPADHWQDSCLEEDTGALDIVAVVDHHWAKEVALEAAAAGDDPTTAREIILDTLETNLSERRYLLLSADLEAVEGAVVRSRWLQRLGEGLDLADIASDWVYEIEQLRDVGVRGFMHEMDEVARKAGHPGLYGDDPGA